MPRYHGVGPRIRECLLAAGYVRPDGEPDVREFCFKYRYDKTLFYEWLGDRKTPTKELRRLVSDLQTTRGWLLFGEGTRHVAAVLLSFATALLLGVGLLWPQNVLAQNVEQNQIDTAHYVKLARARRWWHRYWAPALVLGTA